MNKTEKVLKGLEICRGTSSCKACPYYSEEAERCGSVSLFDDAAELIKNNEITTQQAINHLKETGWLKMYEEYILMKKRLGFITEHEEYEYENWH